MPNSRWAFSAESLACAALTMMVEPNSRRMEPGGALDGSVGPSTSRILRDGVHAFIDQRDALLRAGLGPLGLRQFGRRVAGHEPDDVVKLIVAVKRAEDFAELLFLGRREF